MALYSEGWAQALYSLLPVSAQNAMTALYGGRLEARVYGREYYDAAAELVGREHWTLEQHQAAQASAVGEFVRWAAEHSAFWAGRFVEAGLDPRRVASLEGLRALPPVDRETVRGNAEHMVAGPFRRRGAPVERIHTSGTMGRALHLSVSRWSWVREYAFRDQHRSWCGFRLGERVATFAGHPIVPAVRMRPPYWRHNAAQNQLLFSAQHISPETLPSYVEALRRWTPRLIHGYPSALYLVALGVLESGMEDVRPKGVYSHSETLLPYQREAIERAFGCKVFDWYGTSELAGNVVECEAGSLHVRMEHSALEILRPDGKAAGAGEEGEIVVTAFANRCTPLIRYRVGDVAVRAADAAVCACGRTLPRIDAIVGRVEDIIVTPDGRHVGRLDHAFKDTLNVREAQLVQDEIDVLRVRIVPRDGFSERDLACIERELRLRLGSEISLTYEMLESIPREASGKFRFQVSHVPLALGRQPGEMTG